ncbi:GL18790 [Drosophila persimilis]|uniref:GL18790 n=1 Tax=Drosophila persimilis TaxID=7234 RepID=B4G8P8_DROPE|nr:GL18790 [Drosophila persimilis]
MVQGNRKLKIRKNIYNKTCERNFNNNKENHTTSNNSSSNSRDFNKSYFSNNKIPNRQHNNNYKKKSEKTTTLVTSRRQRRQRQQQVQTCLVVRLQSLSQPQAASLPLLTVSNLSFGQDNAKSVNKRTRFETDALAPDQRD